MCQDNGELMKIKDKYYKITFLFVLNIWLETQFDTYHLLQNIHGLYLPQHVSGAWHLHT